MKILHRYRSFEILFHEIRVKSYHECTIRAVESIITFLHAPKACLPRAAFSENTDIRPFKILPFSGLNEFDYTS